MTKYGDSSSNAVDGERGRDSSADPAFESPGIGKRTLVQHSLGPGAAGPTKPGGRSLVERLAPIAPADRGLAQLKASAEADSPAPPSGQPHIDEHDGHHADAESAPDVASGPPSQRHPAAKPRA